MPTNIHLSKRSMNPSDPSLTWQQVNENWRVIEEALNNYSIEAYEMNGKRMSINISDGVKPSVIAIDEAGKVSVVDVTYLHSEIQITTKVNFRGTIILK